MANGLTPKQTAFLAAYIGDAHGVGVTAARKAGYAGNDNVLGVTAFDNLRNPKIAAAIRADKARVRTEGIAVREERIKSQHMRWEKMHAVIDARADCHRDEAPGSDTGLLVRQIKVVGTGPAAQTVEEWVVDTGLLAEMRQLEQHTAKELGQWIDKQEHTGRDGGPIEVRNLAKLTLEELDELERLSDKLAEPGSDPSGEGET